MHHIWAAFRLQISILHGQTLESEGSFSDAVHRGLHFDRAPPNPLPSPTQTSQCEPKGSPHSAFNIIKKRLLQNTVSHATTQLSICFLRLYMRETLPLFRSTRHNVSKWTTRRYTPDVDRINSEKFPRWFFFFLSNRKTPSMPAYSTVRLLRCGSEGRVWIRWWMPQHSDVLFWWMQKSLLRACLVHERRSRLRSVLFCLQINTRCFTITQRKKKKKCTEIMRSGFHLSVEK